MNNRIKLARDFTKKIRNEHIKRVVLFGSVARGDDNEYSDIDILILTDSEELVEDEISDVVMDVLLYEGELISAHIMDVDYYNKTRGFSFLKNVFDEGIVLY